MTNTKHRLPGEGTARPEKENATAGNRGVANKAHQTSGHFTRETSRGTECDRGLYVPSRWSGVGRSATPPSHGRPKRKSCAAAIRTKRRYPGSGIAAELAGLLLLAVVAGLLLVGLA